ncbi:SWI/SNF complex subunit SWI3C homolog isoform X2 [Magnolia sinica]|uniref:SWI/SNF complex subunit SWI3C homolog isoform X2 n=1 Tax=Magnolia sinica TaxID=86752 RepID=UPI00265A0275|nr:SWI/SNF complex subunit SWI3C homolog isoform X2 [Magnolia sinica]
MSASPSFPTPDTRPNKWKKRKTESNIRNPTKKQQQQRLHHDDEDDDEEEEDPALEEEDDDNEDNEDSPAAAGPAAPNLEAEILSDSSTRISRFPPVIKHTINRLHPSVLALAAADRAVADGRSRTPPPHNAFFLENISHGQIQAISLVPSGSPALAPADHDRPDGPAPSYVCTPPAIMEGKGVVKHFGSQCQHVVPMHSDWFSPTSVHRLERQVVPHFFSGKSNDFTPERYMEVRNRIVAKYMENPDKRLTDADCQSLNVGIGMHDLSRIVRFLDNWGIINYMAELQPRHGIGGPSLREDVNGEIHVPSTSLKSIDSLIRFDKPKSRLKPEEVSSSSSSSSAVRISDLDSRIRERLAENRCNYCTRALTHMYYQSQKADIMLCSDCFHDGKFVAGNASIDFARVNSARDFCYLDGDSWTDQETLLLLEALEIFGDNWNDIAEHVATKSKAQCILQFIRLPMEDGLLDNIEFPSTALSSDNSKEDEYGKAHSNVNGESEEACLQDLDNESRLPFAKSGNPVMSLVAFLASAVGPRVAAACAHASLAALSKEDHNLIATNTIVQMEGSSHGDRLNAESMHAEGREMTSLGHQAEETLAAQGSHGKNDATATPLSPERVRAAAKFGLSAAASKAKMFADHEEREIQRLVAAIINHQLKRLELKLKQFAEVETLLMKECEQVERTRQRLSAERARMISTRFGSAGSTGQPGAVAANSSNSSNIRPPVVMPGPAAQANIPPYGNNQPTHPHMSFMPRQPMFAFGPRLPLSMIHPSSSSPSATVMFPSTPANAPAQNHPMLRPVSGTNTNIG